MFDFTGKVAVVTGAGGGIGRATVLGFVKAGAKVVVVDVAEDLGKETVDLVKKQGGDAIFVAADVTKEPDIANYVREAVKAYGRIDVFVNNAGWEGVVKPIPEYPTETFDRVLAINVRGAFLGLKYVMPIMKEQKSGAIINVASGAAYLGSPGMAAYIASKHALAGLTKVAALEVAKDGIRVNACCPGPVETRMMRSLEEGFAPGAGDAAKEGMAAAIPDGRYATPEECANLIMYLASDFSSHITGQGILIDGGQIMR